MKYDLTTLINNKGIISFDAVQANDEVVMYSMQSIGVIAQYFISKAIQAGKRKNLLVEFKREPAQSTSAVFSIEKITARFLPHTTAQPEPAPVSVLPPFSSNYSN